MGFACSLRARLFVADLPVALARFNLRSLMFSALRTIFEWVFFFERVKNLRGHSETQINHLIFFIISLLSNNPCTHVHLGMLIIFHGIINPLL